MFALVLKSPPCLLWVFISSTRSFKNIIYSISISLTLKGKNKNWILLKGSMAITFTSICISFTAFYLFYIILFNRLWTLPIILFVLIWWICNFLFFFLSFLQSVFFFFLITCQLRNKALSCLMLPGVIVSLHCFLLEDNFFLVCYSVHFIILSLSLSSF